MPFKDISSFCFLLAAIAAFIGIVRPAWRDTVSWAVLFIALGLLLIGK